MINIRRTGTDLEAWKTALNRESGIWQGLTVTWEWSGSGSQEGDLRITRLPKNFREQKDEIRRHNERLRTQRTEEGIRYG